MAITIRKRDSILVAQVAAPVFDRIIGPVLTRLKIAPDALRAPVVHRQSG
ncbi:hypothetical protein QPR83_24365 (plasmid) [Enterobacter hormaechei]|nr:hypothetical protein [Enterobacter hormaechei]MCM8289428.1 hypothetical protein [Enterobacter hormaechei]WLZ56817.1 hypothetical protein QPR83_24365 [Enterobacter hormaechei]HAS0755485.1 hypothetical protein [Enterobacter hormaechei subsp. hoffmannii]